MWSPQNSTPSIYRGYTPTYTGKCRFFILRLPQNSRQLHAPRGTDNQQLTKSYENPVAFFVFVFLDVFCDINPLEQ